MNRAKPLVSVLMGVFNQETYLDESIQSILNQSYSNFEFIIIDDSSTDNSLAILNKYQHQDNRIRLVTNVKNMGHPKSLNIGLAKSMGQYIARMDADDIAKPTRLERLVEFMESDHSIGLCGSAIEYFGMQHGVKVYPMDDLELRLSFLKENPFAHPTTMIRADILKKYGFQYKENYTAAEDFLMWVKISEVSKIHNLSEPLLRYRVHKSQLTSTQSEKQKEEKNETLTYIYGKIGFDSTRYSYLDFIKILNNNYKFSLESLTKSHEILRHAMEANDSSNYLPKKEFNETILEKWKRMTHGSTRLGLPFFSLFYKSLLSRWGDLAYSFKVRFFIKCMLKL